MTDQPKRRGRPPKVRDAPFGPAHDAEERYLASRAEHEAWAASLVPEPMASPPGAVQQSKPLADATMTSDEAHVDALTATDAWPDLTVTQFESWRAGRADPVPTQRYRFKGGAMQQAWQHPTGVQWRPLPIVPADAPDWEDA